MILEILSNKKKEWWFRIKGVNGRIVANSETYKRESYCRRIVKKIASTATWKIHEVKK